MLRAGLACDGCLEDNRPGLYEARLQPADRPRSAELECHARRLEEYRGPCEDVVWLFVRRMAAPLAELAADVADSVSLLADAFGAPVVGRGSKAAACDGRVRGLRAGAWEMAADMPAGSAAAGFWLASSVPAAMPPLLPGKLLLAGVSLSTAGLCLCSATALLAGAAVVLKTAPPGTPSEVTARAFLALCAAAGVNVALVLSGGAVPWVLAAAPGANLAMVNLKNFVAYPLLIANLGALMQRKPSQMASPILCAMASSCCSVACACAPSPAASKALFVLSCTTFGWCGKQLGSMEVEPAFWDSGARHQLSEMSNDFFICGTMTSLGFQGLVIWGIVPSEVALQGVVAIDAASKLALNWIMFRSSRARRCARGITVGVCDGPSAVMY